MRPALRPLIGRLALATLLASAAVLPARAVEPTGNAIADAFLAGIEASGASKLAIESVSGDDDTAEIIGFSSTIDDDGDTSDMAIDRIVIDDAALADGRIDAGSVTLNGVTITNGKGKFTAGRASATGVRIPSARDISGGANAIASEADYDSARVDGIVISGEDGYTVPVESVSFTAEQGDGSGPVRGTVSASRIVLDVASMPADDAKKELTRLGYDRLTLSFDAAGNWDPATATGKVETLALSAEGIGKLTLSATIGGLTEEVVAKLRSPSDEDETTQLLQGLTIAEVSIAFDNETLVNRLLAAQAKEAGTTPETLADQLASALPAMLAILKNPEFQSKLAHAGALFLREPVSFVATAKPAAPVPVAMLFGTAMMAPQTLPQVLNVDVVANGQE